MNFLTTAFLVTNLRWTIRNISIQGRIRGRGQEKLLLKGVLPALQKCHVWSITLTSPPPPPFIARKFKQELQNFIVILYYWLSHKSPLTCVSWLVTLHYY